MEVSKQYSILTELNYFAPVSWYQLTKSATNLKVDIYEHYQKGSWRNRCYIAGPNRVQLLTVPLERGKNERRAFKDVRISKDHPWQKEHWRSLCSCYRRSAYFEYFEDDLAPIFEKRYDFLLDWNLELLHFTFKPLQWEPKIEFTNEYVIPGDKENDIRTASVKSDLHEIAGKNIQPYNQVFSDRFPFQRNLSIIDMIFNLGKVQL